MFRGEWLDDSLVLVTTIVLVNTELAQSIRRIPFEALYDDLLDVHDARRARERAEFTMTVVEWTLSG